MPYVELLFKLLVGHAIADFPLQGEFLAQAKCKDGVPGVPWQMALAWHSLIHGGFVFVATGSVEYGLLETLLHYYIDWIKCLGFSSFKIDQWLHIACKLLYLVLISLQLSGNPRGL
jgi:hypothetical protein